MNVLVISNLYPPDYNGGYELACAQAVDALRMRGHSVTVLTSTPRIPVPRENDVLRRLAFPELLFDYRRASRASPDAGKLRTTEAAGFSPHNVELLLEVLDDRRPDIVYLWNVDGLGVLGIIGTLASMQVPVTWHLMDHAFARVLQALGESAGSILRSLSEELRGNYISCSSRLIHEIERSGYPLADRTVLVPNWVVTPRSEREREYYPHAGGLLRLVTAGQLLDHKGIGIILEAAGLLLRRGLTSFVVDVYGDGDVEGYRRAIDESGLERHVSLRGRKTPADMQRAFWDYDAFLFPTWRREPFGMAPLEAAATGCVPIVSRSCGIAEWLIDGVDCIKVRRDSTALAATLEDILAGRVDITPLGRRVRRVAERAFHIDRVIPRIEDALKAAAATPASASIATPEDALRSARLADEMLMETVEAL